MAATSTSQNVGQNDSSVANTNRIWVGNLAYKSSEQDLKDAFAGLQISDVSLPERFGRRQGYAFVTFDKAEDVEKAVTEINGKELLGREMRVQKATSGGPYTSENGEHGDAAGGETKKARSKPRKGTPRRTQDGGAEVHETEVEPTQAAESDSTRTPRRRRVPPKTTDEGVSEEGDGSGERKKVARRAIRKGPPEDGTPSTTTIYVANIPFEYTDDKLKELFAAYNPTSAYIVPRQIPRFVIRKLAERGEARKGRGFGFVSFDEEASQKKAVEEMNGREVESRAISVKVAIDKPPRDEKEAGDEAVPVAANGSS